MKKFLASLAFVAVLTASMAAHAGGDELGVKKRKIQSLDTLSATSLVAGDYVPVYDASADKTVKVDASSFARSGAPISVTGTYNATCDTNGNGKINFISSSGSNATITLPAATGTGCEYRFTWANVPSGSGDAIQVTGNDEFRGVVYTLSDNSAAVLGYAAAATSDNDKMNFTSSTKFGATAGVSVIFRDVGTDVYNVQGMGSSTGSEASPFATGQRS